MTSQVLVNNRLSESDRSQALAENSLAIVDLSDLLTLSSHQELQTKLSKLPYQATHQAELLHLQAEIEALLQQLQTLKRQRLTLSSDEP